MDGDHLDGSWVQNCRPASITHPDVYAYGRPVSQLPGKYSYRLCFRLSASELLRTQAALSWNWQPRTCQLTPVDGSQFDKWLGARLVLLVGDSLMGQLFYSLLFLLGSAVTQIRRFPWRNNMAQAALNASVQSACESSAGSEGDGQAIEAVLQGGGRILFVMTHFAHLHQLQKNADSAPWASHTREASVMVVHGGHHYRQIDPSFKSYGALVRGAEASLASVMRPDANLVLLTTNVGHRDCEKAKQPFESPRTAWEQLVSNGSPYEWQPPNTTTRQRFSEQSLEKGRERDPYDWRAPALHEVLWREVFARSEAFAHRFRVLNVSFLDARPDGHVGSARSVGGVVDCLHYCYPGPADYWAASFYNLVMGL